MPNLQRRGYTFSLPTAQQQWMSYMTWTALVSKIVQYPSKTNEESEHTANFLEFDGIIRKGHRDKLPETSKLAFHPSDTR
jgi:hypothetical protein